MGGCPTVGAATVCWDSGSHSRSHSCPPLWMCWNLKGKSASFCQDGTHAPPGVLGSGLRGDEGMHVGDYAARVECSPSRPGVAGSLGWKPP